MSVDRNKVGHAYIIEGEAGLLDAANAFAKALNCLEGQENACGSCISCRVFDSGNHPDTFYVKGMKTSSIGVDEVREQIIKQMATAPFRYTYKIFIVDKAETMTPQAQSALLKTIEEPASYGVFLLLVTQIEQMLPTVLSRCAVVKHKTDAVKMETNEDITAVVQEIITTPPGLPVYQVMGLYKKFEPFKENKESALILLDMLYNGYGRLIREAGLRREVPDKRLFGAADAITHTKEVLSQNGNFQLAMELMLLKMLSPTTGVKVEST